MSEPAAAKKVTWGELFFDLVFVVAVTRISGLLGHDHSWDGVLHALIVFVPVYWLWVGMAIQTNLQDADRPVLRARMFAIALAAIFMAIALPAAYGRFGLVYALAYWAGRMVTGYQLARAAQRMRRLPINPVSVSILMTGPMLVIGACVHGTAREVIWGAAAVVDLATPTVLRRRLPALHYDAGHLTERFGLFLLIALGESVASIGSSTAPNDLTAAQGCAVAAAFLVSCGLWWVYYHFAADAIRHALATARVQLDITRFVLSYGHLSFIAGVLLVSVGLRESIADPGHHLTWALTGLLLGGCGLYLATFGFTRWMMFRLMSWTRLGAAAVVLLLVPVAPHVPALATMVALAALLCALNLLEYARVANIGWRARLRRRDPDEVPALDP